MTRVVPLFTLLLLSTLILAGCKTANQDSRIIAPAVPADFSLQLTVLGDYPSADPHRRCAQFIVEPNCDLRVAVGDRATSRYYPNLTRVISHDEYQALYRTVEDNQLRSQASNDEARLAASRISTERALAVSTTQPAAAIANPGDPIYYVEIMALGKSHRYTVFPQDSQPTVQLLDQLNALVGLHAVEPTSSVKDEEPLP